MQHQQRLELRDAPLQDVDRVVATRRVVRARRLQLLIRASPKARQIQPRGEHDGRRKRRAGGERQRKRPALGAGVIKV